MSINHPWLESSRFGYLRVSAVSMAVTSNISINAKEIVNKSLLAYMQGSKVIVFSELSLTSYTIQDLHRQDLVRQQIDKYIRYIAEETRHLDMIIIFGSTIRAQNALYNCAIVMYRGDILGIVPKSYLPDYSEFREHRWWSPAVNLKVGYVNVSKFKNVPIGTDLVFSSDVLDNFTLGVEICEDLWVPNPPSVSACVDGGATVICNLSASPEQICKYGYRHDLVKSHSARLNAAYVYAGVGFGESTSDLAWSGDSIIADRGQELISSQTFQSTSQIITADIDLVALRQDRLRTTSYSQITSRTSNTFRYIPLLGPSGYSGYLQENLTILRDIDPHPLIPKTDFDKNQTLMIQVTSLKRRMQVFPEGERKIVIGLSGGKDSTWALLVAYTLVSIYGKELGMIYADIIGITMPGFGTTNDTFDAATELADALGISFRTIPIDSLTQSVLDAVDFPGYVEGESPWTYRLAYENSQAWMRKQIELIVATFASDLVGALVLGSGTMSELLLGWTTIFGDQAAHYAINIGLAKSAIPVMIEWFADLESTDPLLADVLYKILGIAASPELAPLDEDGEQKQNTEEINGPYEVHDFFAYYFLRFGFTPQRIARMAYQVFLDKYTWSDILKWLEVFIKRVFSQQYKRNTLSVEGPKIGSVALSSRDEWRMPGDVQATMWLEDLAQIPIDL